MIRVSHELNADSEKREIRGLKEAMGKCHSNEAIILTYDQEKEIKIKDITVPVIPVWKFLLSNTFAKA